jgi:hypothetical protein
MGVGSVFMLRVSDYGNGHDHEECGYKVPEEYHYADSRESVQRRSPDRTSRPDHDGAAKARLFLAGRFEQYLFVMHFDIQRSGVGSFGLPVHSNHSRLFWLTE